MITLDSFKGYSWTNLTKFIQESRHALVLNGNGPEYEAAIAANMYGAEAGSAIIVANLYMKENGCNSTVKEAVKIYRKFYPNHEKVRTLDENVSWLGFSKKNPKWPIKPQFKLKNKWCGLANVMMGLSCRELSMGTTNEIIVANTIMFFLNELSKQAPNRKVSR
jgi:hypothetical protein